MCDGRCEKVLEDHSRPVLSLAISNSRLYSGSYDYNIKVSGPGVYTISTIKIHLLEFM